MIGFLIGFIVFILIVMILLLSYGRVANKRTGDVEKEWEKRKRRIAREREIERLQEKEMRKEDLARLPVEPLPKECYSAGFQFLCKKQYPDEDLIIGVIEPYDDPCTNQRLVRYRVKLVETSDSAA